MKQQLSSLFMLRDNRRYLPAFVREREILLISSSTGGVGRGGDCRRDSGAKNMLINVSAK